LTEKKEVGGVAMKSFSIVTLADHQPADAKSGNEPGAAQPPAIKTSTSP